MSDLQTVDIGHDNLSMLMMTLLRVLEIKNKVCFTVQYESGKTLELQSGEFLFNVFIFH